MRIPLTPTVARLSVWLLCPLGHFTLDAGCFGNECQPFEGGLGQWRASQGAQGRQSFRRARDAASSILAWWGEASCPAPRPHRWQLRRSSGSGCLRSVRTGWQESEPPRKLSLRLRGPGWLCWQLPRLALVQSGPGTRLAWFAHWGRGTWKVAPPPVSLTFVQRLIGPNPLLGRIGWRVCIPGGRGRQAGTEEASSSNEGAGVCWSLGEGKSKCLRCSLGRGWQVGREAAEAPLPVFARRSVLSSGNDSWQHQLSLREGAVPGHLGLPFPLLYQGRRWGS